MLGINRDAAREMAKSGRFPNAIRHASGHYRIPLSDVEAYLAASRVHPTPPTSPASRDADNAAAGADPAGSAPVAS